MLSYTSLIILKSDFYKIDLSYTNLVVILGFLAKL